MFTVFVQTVPTGRDSWDETRASIEASDIGRSYYLLTQDERVAPRQHFLGVLESMSKCSTEWALRLEDDVLVNKHILHNLRRWPAKWDTRFGAGWCFDAGGATRTTHDRMYGRIGQDKWHVGLLHCCQGVLLRTADIPELRRLCEEWFQKNPGRLSQDIALSHAVATAGKQICIHAPSLLEHLIQYKSTLQNAHTRSHTSEGTFSPDWRRQ